MMKSNYFKEQIVPNRKTYLYAWGANNYGQLGLGFTCDQVIEPTLVENLPDNLNLSKVKTRDNGKIYSSGGISGGGGHSFLLTEDGKLFGVGRNDFGQVGNGTLTKVILNFEAIRGLESQQVISVACGWNHTIALTADNLSEFSGKVWVWGSNSHSQLGLPTNEVPFSSLPICLDIPDVVSISAGLRHTVIVTKNNRVYSWGQGLKGQLGHMDEYGRIVTKQQTPKIISCLDDCGVKIVACGQNTTYALSQNGDVMAWGDNKWGQLALDPESVPFFAYPLVLSTNYFDGACIRSISSGWSHCYVWAEGMGYYGWGRIDYGQLGVLASEDPVEAENSSIGIENLLLSQPDKPPETPAQDNKLSRHKRYRYIPRRLNHLQDLPEAVRVRCGSEHTLVHWDDRLFAFGWNEHGSCGTGHTDDVFIPAAVPLRGHVREFGAGAGQSFAVMIQCIENKEQCNICSPTG